MVTGSTVFEYNALPECTSSCKIIQASETNCVPPVSNHFTYQDCVCQSTYLGSLQKSGAICHGACSDEDDELIHEYYNRMCGQSNIPETTTSRLPPTTTLSTLITGYKTLVTVQAPMKSAPPPQQTHVEVIENQEPWLQQNGKYFARIGGGVVILIAILLVLVHLYKRHNRKSALENAGQRHPFIPLQDVNPLPNQPFGPATHQQPSLQPHSSSESDLGYSSRFPGITRPQPSFTFGATVRAYASDSQNDLHEMQHPTGRCGTLCRSLSRTERLIIERIRTTGRPDIPISATPKIVR
ncbi:hypothetical protein COCSADRAFT_343867 [Bipolaris sorokiniana ND90Pr]|uniref:Uncharacterized protein n=1 Tax=Cochliobolus sativus (strain ND90Pr / ATCC 201652) TaxID=665912 RepID=M2SZ38_COCSN|nr:uncharacterized protein COCSADRAFT_343867 [Bipolaris sorokiniana ND90Pr]EMD62206.1 hypothetical protein COCSADRAFT_343867 [Bipolaris sorokiniana ND90Pr]